MTAREVACYPVTGNSEGIYIHVDLVLDGYTQPGERATVQHIALGTTDIYGTVDALRGRGVEFQNTPDTYYEAVDRRVAGHRESPAKGNDHLHRESDRDVWRRFMQPARGVPEADGEQEIDEAQDSQPGFVSGLRDLEEVDDRRGKEQRPDPEHEIRDCSEPEQEPVIACAPEIQHWRVRELVHVATA